MFLRRNPFFQNGLMYFANSEDDSAGSNGTETPATKPTSTGEETETVKNEETKDKAPEKPSVSDKEAELLKEVMAKKNQIKELANQLDEFKSRFDGINPDEVRELFNQRKAEETERLKKKGEFDKITAQMAEEHARKSEEYKKQLAEKDQVVQRLNSTIYKLTIGNEFATSDFIKSDLVPSPRHLQRLFEDHFEVDEDGGVVGYTDASGSDKRQPLVDDAGKPLSFDEALRRIIENDPDKDRLIRSKAKPGADSSTNNAGPTKSASPANSRDRIASGLRALAKGT